MKNWFNGIFFLLAAGISFTFNCPVRADNQPGMSPQATDYVKTFAKGFGVGLAQGTINRDLQSQKQWNEYQKGSNSQNAFNQYAINLGSWAGVLCWKYGMPRTPSTSDDKRLFSVGLLGHALGRCLVEGAEIKDKKIHFKPVTCINSQLLGAIAANLI